MCAALDKGGVEIGIQRGLTAAMRFVTLPAADVAGSPVAAAAVSRHGLGFAFRRNDDSGALVVTGVRDGSAAAACRCLEVGDVLLEVRRHRVFRALVLPLILRVSASHCWSGRRRSCRGSPCPRSARHAAGARRLICHHRRPAFHRRCVSCRCSRPSQAPRLVIDHRRNRFRCSFAHTPSAAAPASPSAVSCRRSKPGHQQQRRWQHHRSHSHSSS